MAPHTDVVPPVRSASMAYAKGSSEGRAGTASARLRRETGEAESCGRLLRLVRCGSSPRPLHRPVGPRTLAASPPCQPRRALCIVARRMAAYSVGIDVGGTFTDCFVTDGVHGWRGKAPTTPRAPLCGLLAALEDAAAAIGVPLARALGDAVHLGLGTTVVTNCLAA